jgi:hypothetical protein
VGPVLTYSSPFSLFYPRVACYVPAPPLPKACCCPPLSTLVSCYVPHGKPLINSVMTICPPPPLVKCE